MAALVLLAFAPLHAWGNDSGKLATKEFGNGKGWISSDFGASDYTADVALQVDEKIVVAGTSGGRFAVARYGYAIDPTFGEGGVAFVDFDGADARASAVAIQADGKIVVGGSGRLANGDLRVFLARLLPNGQLDATFGTGGRVVVRQLALQDLAIQPDGKIVAALIGVVYSGVGGNVMVARFLPNGLPDQSFTTYSFLPGISSLMFSTDRVARLNSMVGAKRLAVQSTGRIVVAFDYKACSATGSCLDPEGSFGVLRLNDDGSLDTSFGDNGIRAYPGSGIVGGMVLSSADGVHVLSTAEWGIYITRLWNDGSTAAFAGGQDGGFERIYYDLGDLQKPYNDWRIALEDSGHMVVVGNTLKLYCDDCERIFTARFTPEGLPDPLYNGDGISRLEFDGIATSMALRGDRFYVSGNYGGGADLDFLVMDFVNRGENGYGTVVQYVTGVQCPAAVTADTAPNVCSAPVTYSTPVGDDPGLTTCIPPSGATFQLGATTTTCTTVVGDGSQNQQRTASCSFPVTVVDAQFPSLTCPAVVVSTTAGRCDATPTIPVVATDNCPALGAPTITPASGSTFARGVTPYSARVVDGAGNAQTCASTVTVNDREAPKVNASIARSLLWEPNSSMVDVGLAYSAKDNCGAAPTVTVTIYSNEPDAPVDGQSFSPDATLVNGALRLRAERFAVRDGRVYLAVLRATDTDGNVGVAVATSAVPRDTSAARVASVTASAAAASAYAVANAGAPPPGYVVVGSGAVAGPKQ